MLSKMRMKEFDPLRGPDLREEIDPFFEEFYLRETDEQKRMELLEQTQHIFFAIGNVGLFYLDDWTPAISKEMEDAVQEYFSDSVTRQEFRNILEKVVCFIDEHRPFKQGLPILKAVPHHNDN